MTDLPKRTRGYAAALAAYLGWAALPLYWTQLKLVSPLELVAHRVVWSFVLVAIVLTIRGGWGEFVAVLRDGRRRRWMVGSAAFVSANWLLYVASVNGGHVTQASLGYYVSPLLNVLIGRVFLGERLRAAQAAAVGLATLGVLNLAIAGGAVPWFALALAFTFAAYGLLRKQAPVEALTGLAVETGLALPFAIAILVPAALDGTWAWAGASAHTAALLPFSGVATAVPLLLFAIAARSMRYGTLGIFQYLSPTGQLALAVWWGEPFTATHAITFGLIWGAVAIYAADALWAQRRVAGG